MAKAQTSVCAAPPVASPNRTREEVGRKILKALQGGKLSAMGTCRYQTRSGKSCAVGHLLPSQMKKEIIKQGLNEETVLALANAGFAITPYFGGMNLDEVNNLQIAYDCNTSKAAFIRKLKKVCNLK